MPIFLEDHNVEQLLEHLDTLRCPNADEQIAALETMLLAWDEGNEELFCDAWEKLKVGDYRLGIDTALAGQTAESNFEQPHARAKNVIEELKIRVTPSEQLREAKTNG